MNSRKTSCFSLDFDLEGFLRFSESVETLTGGDAIFAEIGHLACVILFLNFHVTISLLTNQTIKTVCFEQRRAALTWT